MGDREHRGGGEGRPEVSRGRWGTESTGGGGRGGLRWRKAAMLPLPTLGSLFPRSSVSCLSGVTGLPLHRASLPTSSFLTSPPVSPHQIMSELPVKWCCRVASVATAHGKPLDHQLTMTRKGAGSLNATS